MVHPDTQMGDDDYEPDDRMPKRQKIKLIDQGAVPGSIDGIIGSIDMPEKTALGIAQCFESGIGVELCGSITKEGGLRLLWLSIVPKPSSSERLVRAAPDLLDAARKLVAYQEVESGDMNDWELQKMYDAAVVAAEEAIAKAVPGSPVPS